MLNIPGNNDVYDLRTRKMDDMLIADVHIEVDASLTVENGHAVDARRRVPERHRVLNLMTHIDPWRRPDLDHDSEPPPINLEKAG